MKKIILMRHSIPEKVIISTELIPLSKAGLQKIEEAKEKVYSHNIDKCYSSSYKRAFQTAKGLFDEVKIMNDLHERVIGENPNENFWRTQYSDYDYKLIGGESLNEVKTRMKSVIDSIVHEMDEGETSLVVSHATAICSFFLNYAELQVTDYECKLRRIIFNNKIILDGRIDNMGYFELEFIDDVLENACYYEI